MAQDSAERVRRTWYYAQPPKAFEVAACACGNANTQWSEYEGHCWCEACQIDFKPAHAGIFGGPIPTQLAHALGLRFDRVSMATGKLDRFDPRTSRYESETAA